MNWVLILFENRFLSYLADYLIISILFMLIPLSIAGIYRLLKNPSAKLELIKDEYEKQLEVLRKENDRLRKIIEEKDRLHRKELENVMYRRKMALALHEAVHSGSIRVVCPEHDQEVEILLDGTLVCREGHRIIPAKRPEIKFETPGEEEYESV